MVSGWYESDPPVAPVHAPTAMFGAMDNAPRLANIREQIYESVPVSDGPVRSSPAKCNTSCTSASESRY
jgi:hypothetical protein